MKRIILFLIIVASIVFLIMGQGVLQLEFGVEVQGQISADTNEAIWQFSGLRDQIVSVSVDGKNGFDPIITLRFSTGEIVISNDDFSPDSKHALLEGITLPQTGQYDVIVSGYAGESGAYSLLLLPGYSEVVASGVLNTLDNWQADTMLSMNKVADGIEMKSTGVQVAGLAIYDDLQMDTSYYIDTRIQVSTGRDGWVVGVVLNYQPGEQFYLYSINSFGNWRIEAIQGDSVRILRDWSPHPAIVPGETSLNPGVLYNNGAIELFYNRQLVGKIFDDEILGGGKAGIQIVTANSLQGEVTAILNEFFITTPKKIDDGFVFPGDIMRGNASLMIQELERRHLIPVGGREIFNVDESFVENRNPGVDVLILAQGTTVTDYAFGTTVSIESEIGAEGLVGCGLLMGSVNDMDHVLAFIDNEGGYGVSLRKGEEYAPGLFDLSAGWATQPNHDLVVVVNDGQLNFWVNGKYIGTISVPIVSGEVGNSTINFDPINVTCKFSNTWLWSWEK